MHIIETDYFELFLLIVLYTIYLGDKGIDDFFSWHFESIFRHIFRGSVPVELVVSLLKDEHCLLNVDVVPAHLIIIDILQVQEISI